MKTKRSNAAEKFWNPSYFPVELDKAIRDWAADNVQQACKEQFDNLNAWISPLGTRSSKLELTVCGFDYENKRTKKTDVYNKRFDLENLLNDALDVYSKHPQDAQRIKAAIQRFYKKAMKTLEASQS